MFKQRLKIITITVSFCYLLVIGRLFYWQIIKNPDLGQKVINQNYKPEVITPNRGKIYDSNNYPLVLNQTFYQLSIYKPDLKIKTDNLLNFIKNIHPNLNSEDIVQITNFIGNPNLKWLTLKSLFSNDQKQSFHDPGLTFTINNLRYYPEKNLGSLLLGSVSTGGLENYYQKQLSGKYGFSWQNVDATGKTILTKPGWYLDPHDGLNLHTSVNRQIQYLAETTLTNGINQYHADSGSITIINPQTGGILAMTSFTATQSAIATASAYKNPIISDLFEPGSIFKPLIVSMALDLHTINTDYICTKCDKPHQIGEYSISNWDNSLHPNSSLQDIIKNSDNIGMSYIISTIGLDNFLHYFQTLGLDRKTGIDLQGEAKPMSKTIWPEIDLATASFGQGFAITQIQMLQAFNTIANDGLMPKPHLIDYFDDNGQIIRNNFSSPTKIFNPETIQKVKTILKYAVENGVVAKFKPDNLEVCAKSGTAQVAIKGGYSESATNASYVGFSPCQNPKFTMIVTINNPKSSPWGSSTAAPIWFELASQITPLL
jgi:cell division protein FtsI/penicillin-binding protein 2